MRRLLTVASLLLVLAGCGQQAGNSAEDFEGEERAVAQVVEELQEAGERGEADRICREILVQELVAQLNQAGTTCPAEMQRAIDDADEVEVQVEDVTVTGQTARATVARQGDQDGTTVFEFRLVRGEWRASSLSS